MSALVENNGDVPGVSELVARIRSNLENNFAFVWVRGEVSDFSRGPTGHFYFSLKDENSRLRCVWFSGSQRVGRQRFNPLTGEVYDSDAQRPASLLRNGIELVCAGKVSFYAQGGHCQLIVEFVELAGDGILAQAFEALKKSLAARGFFDRASKQQLPRNPARVALVTSLHGAAVHDFLRIGRQRGLASVIRLFPVPVQGTGAAEKIAETLKFINDQGWADVIVLIRGGGSREDLWSFNEEIVVRAIYESGIPLLTGIGHEIDRSLSDLAADESAATPSHAAQILWPMRSELEQKLDALYLRLEGIQKRRLDRWEAYLGQKTRLLKALSPAQALARLEGRLAVLDRSLVREINLIIDKKKSELKNFSYFLQIHSPQARVEILESKIAELSKKHQDFYGTFLEFRSSSLKDLSRRLSVALERIFQDYAIRLERLDGLLKLLNPENPLQRGYALVFQDGRILRSTKKVKFGEKLKIRLADGELEAKVSNNSFQLSPEK